MATVFTFENGKQICFDRTIYANGKYVLLKDYQLLDEERRAVRDQLTRANNQIDDLKEQISKLEKTRSSWADNAVEWREKCAKAEKQIKELEHKLRKKTDSETDGLDFTEHDKAFEDEISDLRKKLREYKDYITQLKRDLEKTYNQLMEVEKDAQERIAELESELEVKDNLLKIKNGLCKPPMMTVVVAKTINGHDYVRLEDFMSVVNDLQNCHSNHAE